MSDEHIFGRVPESITFGYKILFIPTLAEVGIPVAGLGLARLNPALSGYSTQPESCWIRRGQPLLTYNVRYFKNRESTFWENWIGEPIESIQFEIRSPISGLYLSARNEDTIDLTLGLQYQWCKERRLPVMLVPENEPLPDGSNFAEYDRIAGFFNDRFYLLPARYREDINPTRLKDYLNKVKKKETIDFYEESRKKLLERDSDGYKTYEIREITETDKDLVDNIQYLRGKDLQLREKLLHIAKKYGKSI